MIKERRFVQHNKSIVCVITCVVSVAMLIMYFLFQSMEKGCPAKSGKLQNENRGVLYSFTTENNIKPILREHYESLSFVFDDEGSLICYGGIKGIYKIIEENPYEYRITSCLDGQAIKEFYHNSLGQIIMLYEPTRSVHIYSSTGDFINEMKLMRDSITRNLVPIFIRPSPDNMYVYIVYGHLIYKYCLSDGGIKARYSPDYYIDSNSVTNDIVAIDIDNSTGNIAIAMNRNDEALIMNSELEVLASVEVSGAFSKYYGQAFIISFCYNQDEVVAIKKTEDSFGIQGRHASIEIVSIAEKCTTQIVDSGNCYPISISQNRRYLIYCKRRDDDYRKNRVDIVIYDLAKRKQTVILKNIICRGTVERIAINNSASKVALYDGRLLIKNIKEMHDDYTIE